MSSESKLQSDEFIEALADAAQSCVEANEGRCRCEVPLTYSRQELERMRVKFYEVRSLSIEPSATTAGESGIIPAGSICYRGRTLLMRESENRNEVHHKLFQARLLQCYFSWTLANGKS